MSDIVLPELGEHVTLATIVKWHVAPGDRVAEGDLIVEIMTDKVGMDVQAERAGTIAELLAEEDQEVRVGAVIARMED